MHHFFGLGIVLHHIMPDGTQRPITFAFKTLSSVEKHYSQTEKSLFYSRGLRKVWWGWGHVAVF